jgi:hypothetical protein
VHACCDIWTPQELDCTLGITTTKVLLPHLLCLPSTLELLPGDMVDYGIHLQQDHAFGIHSQYSTSL